LKYKNGLNERHDLKKNRFVQFPGQNTVFDRFKMSLSDAVCREDLRIDGHNSPDEKEPLFFLKVQRSLIIFTIVHGESMIKIPLIPSSADSRRLKNDQ
jgi:hypothetical protein